MYIHDTAAQRLVEFVPREGRVGIYVCGITPYDGGHLGHAFTYHTFDVLARRLRRDGLAVRSVRNITDVDDDMMRVSRERQIDYLDLGNAVVAEFERDMASIGIAPVDAAPRATAHVAEMVEWIAGLESRGAAYAVDGWVYFDVTAFTRYGALSHYDEATMLRLLAERGGNPADERKRRPLDFVLWQPSLPDEPHWISPWSAGRPGWHIECSVLSSAELGLPIDIHGGGNDLIYPHHESEIAQAEAGGAAPFARHWMHTGMVAYDGEKMSKSLGNLVFVHDLVGPAPAAAVRLLLADRHYRGGWMYESGLLEEAVARYGHYSAAAASGHTFGDDAAAEMTAQFLRRLDDDLDLPGALVVLDAAATAALGGVEAAPSGVPAAALFADLLGLLGVTVGAPAAARD